MSDRQPPSRPLILHASFVVLGLIALLFILSLGPRLVQRPADAHRDEPSGRLIGEVIQVEVRNGCGVAGLAGEMTRYLRKRGFDVVEVGDLPSFDQEYTVVYDRVGNLESARKLARAIGLDEHRVVQDIKLDEYLDVSVVIGKDYATLIPFNSTAP